MGRETGAQRQSQGGETAKAKLPPFPVGQGKAGSQNLAGGGWSRYVFVQN